MEKLKFEKKGKKIQKNSEFTGTFCNLQRNVKHLK